MSEESNLGPPLCLGRTVCYIVAAVILDKTKHKILMIQEAKQSAFRRWYLPAGRVEVGEPLCAAVCRETLEESGLHFVPRTITCVEVQGHSWMRFTFTGDAEEGTLKTRPDKESLQAAWLDLELVLGGGSKEFRLRSSDIQVCIRATLRYTEPGMDSYWFLPVEEPSDYIEVSLLISRNKDAPEIVASPGDGALPTIFIGPRSKTGMFGQLKDLFDYLFPSKNEVTLTASNLSVVGVNYAGRKSDDPRDGLQITVHAKTPEKGHGELDPDCGFQWTGDRSEATAQSWLSKVEDGNFRGASLVFLIV